jgi:hypothetical protein
VDRVTGARLLGVAAPVYCLAAVAVLAGSAATRAALDWRARRNGRRPATGFVPLAVRRRVKRWKHARTWRRIEVFTFNCAPVPTWCRIRRWNDAAHIWRRHPERPRKETRR